MLHAELQSELASLEDDVDESNGTYSALLSTHLARKDLEDTFHACSMCEKDVTKDLATCHKGATMMQSVFYTCAECMEFQNEGNLMDYVEDYDSDLSAGEVPHDCSPQCLPSEAGIPLAAWLQQEEGLPQDQVWRRGRAQQGSVSYRMTYMNEGSKFI